MPRTVDTPRPGPLSATRAAGGPADSPAFPGYRSFRSTRDAVDTYDGRFEYWDAATETAWVVAEPTGGAHEQPTRRLAGLCRMIASLRGGAIECRGSLDLVWNAGEPRRRRILQADTGRRADRRRARPAGRGARGRPHDRRPPRQACAVRRVGIPRGVGRRARCPVAVAPAGAGARADRPAARRRRLPDRLRQRRLPRMDGGRDPRRAERAGALARYGSRPRSRRPRPRRPRRHPARRYPVAAPAARGGPRGRARRGAARDARRARDGGARAGARGCRRGRAPPTACSAAAHSPAPRYPPGPPVAARCA